MVTRGSPALVLSKWHNDDGTAFRPRGVMTAEECIDAVLRMRKCCHRFCSTGRLIHVVRWHVCHALQHLDDSGGAVTAAVPLVALERKDAATISARPSSGDAMCLAAWTCPIVLQRQPSHAACRASGTIERAIASPHIEAATLECADLRDAYVWIEGGVFKTLFISSNHLLQQPSDKRFKLQRKETLHRTNRLSIGAVLANQIPTQFCNSPRPHTVAATMSSLRKLIPFGNRVLIKRFEPAVKTASGIYLPDADQQKQNEGEVVAVGPGFRNHEGNLIPVQSAVGDKVLLPEYGGSIVKLGADEFHLFRDEDILGKLE